MDRFYTMRPINLAGEISGYRAELVGVGAGADALRTIMQTAIKRVGVSITPVVCQQLFIEVFNAAVDFACDSGTSVNLADIISFKWNTRGKYNRIDATVPKSALSLTAIVSPKITRNATPRFDLKAQPVEPVINSVLTPFDTTFRGVVARGFNLSNVFRIRVVDATSRAVYVTYSVDNGQLVVSDNGRNLTLKTDGNLLAAIPEGVTGQLEVDFRTAGSAYIPLGPTFPIVARDYSATITTATPQPWNPKGETSLAVLGSGLNLAALCRFEDFDGVPRFSVGVDLPDEKSFQLSTSNVETQAAWTGGALVMKVYTENDLLLATFNVSVSAYSL